MTEGWERHGHAPVAISTPLLADVERLAVRLWGRAGMAVTLHRADIGFVVRCGRFEAGGMTPDAATTALAAEMSDLLGREGAGAINRGKG